VLDAHSRTTGSREPAEDEADRFADYVTGRHAPAPPALTPSTRTGLVHRAISFTHAGDTFTKNDVLPNEDATGFFLDSVTPSFRWSTNVTIHGVAGDPFGDFQVGFHQVERVFGVNVDWGTGTPNLSRRRVRPDAPLPRRDVLGNSPDNIWYDDPGPSVAAPFAANGDVRSPTFQDTPGPDHIPFANPVAGRAGVSGFFNFDDAFVAYLSARNIPAGTGAAAFRAIANVYWNITASGQFDGARVPGSRVTLSRPATTNRSGINDGASAEFPSMHGGTIANGRDVTTDT
jgi:hypothetical protein